MRISKWLKIVGFLAVLFAMNMLLSFLIEPESGASGRMWAGFYEEEEIDTVFVGSSVCQQTFIPYIFDENMGIKSYNMGTPSQAIPQTLHAIEIAMEEHEIKTVVFGMGFSTLKYSTISEAEMTFESARIRKKGGVEGFFEGVAYMYSEDVRNTEDSINFLFPWLYNYENFSRENIVKNVNAKIQRMKENLSTGKSDETAGLKKGYRNDDSSVFNYDNKWVTNSHYIYGEDFETEVLREFEQMLSFCQDNNLELIIINTPHPTFDVVSCYDYYEENQNLIQAYCDKYDVDYYDFSLSKPEIFEIESTYFCDYEHLNKQGAQIFCQKLSEFLNRRAAGENMEQYFYSIDEFFEIHSEEVNDWKEWNE